MNEMLSRPISVIEAKMDASDVNFIGIASAISRAVFNEENEKFHSFDTWCSKMRGCGSFVRITYGYGSIRLFGQVGTKELEISIVTPQANVVKDYLNFRLCQDRKQGVVKEIFKHFGLGSENCIISEYEGETLRGTIDSEELLKRLFDSISIAATNTIRLEGAYLRLTGSNIEGEKAFYFDYG